VAIGTFDDVRRLAQRRVPRAVFDYVDGGAEAELPMRANREAFESGYRMATVSTDAAIFRGAIRAELAEARGEDAGGGGIYG
jgi:hypothetical protein